MGNDRERSELQEKKNVVPIHLSFNLQMPAAPPFTELPGEPCLGLFLGFNSWKGLH